MHPANAFVCILKKTERVQKGDKGIKKPSAFVFLEKSSKIEALHAIPGVRYSPFCLSYKESPEHPTWDEGTSMMLMFSQCAHQLVLVYREWVWCLGGAAWAHTSSPGTCLSGAGARQGCGCKHRWPWGLYSFFGSSHAPSLLFPWLLQGQQEEQMPRSLYLKHAFLPLLSTLAEGACS